MQTIETFDEATIRVQQLNDFLENRNLPKVIWVSEDATGINGRVQYCGKQDAVTGLVISLDANGFPKKKYFPATTSNFLLLSKWEWFKMDLDKGELCMQYAVHILTK